MSLEPRKDLRHCAAAAAALAALGLSSCSLDPVRLGAVLPLTGVYATYGTSLERGVKAAEEQVNAEGGIQGRRLEVLVRDSRSSPEEAVRQFRELVQLHGVSAVVGGATSPEALGMAPAAAELQRVLLTPSASSPRLGSAGEWVFRNWPSDDDEAKVMADFAAFTLHASRILIVAEESPYAEGFSTSFCAQFASANRRAARLGFSAGANAGETLAGRVVSGLPGVQCVLLVGYGEELAPVIGALRRRGVDVPLLSVSALSDEQVLARGGADLEGVVFARPRFDPQSDSPAYLEFAALYRARFGDDPDVYAAHAYDSVRVLAEAIALEGPAPGGVQQGLLKTRGFPGAAGSLTFGAGGEVMQTFELCVVSGGKAVPLALAGDEVLPDLQRRVERLRFEEGP